jgi:hypothetical protein
MTPDIITQVAFVTGTILHQGTGQPVVGEVRLRAKQGPVTSKVLEDGRFAVSGYLRFLFPDLATQPYLLDLTIRADSPQFKTGFIEQPLVVAIPMGRRFDPDPPTVPDPLIDVGTILLPGDPVNVRGRVFDGANPGTPINGATVEVLHTGPVVAPVLTGTDGSYRIDGITVTAPAQIRCSKLPAFPIETRNLLLDFGRQVNEENFRLAPA